MVPEDTGGGTGAERVKGSIEGGAEYDGRTAVSGYEGGGGTERRATSSVDAGVVSSVANFSSARSSEGLRGKGMSCPRSSVRA